VRSKFAEGRRVVRVACVVWVKRRATSEVRATVHSPLSQAENAGEIIFGLTVAVVAGAASTTVALSPPPNWLLSRVLS
jgi:hypothetical protein